jgi:phospholipid/cholesterol/gamma-HCH transport system substrate-binding protein
VREGTRIVVSGGTSGLGRAAARRLVRDGARVWILGSRPKTVERALADLKRGRGVDQDVDLTGDDLAELVDASASVMRAFASEEANISAAVAELPSTLRQTTDTLGRVETFANVLGPAAESLRPAARALDPANRAITPFAKEVTPLLASDIRPFVREARPLVHKLRPASNQLARATPKLTRAFTVLNHFFNLLAFNPNGREGPDNAARQEGYLFWLAWAQHQAIQLFSTSDAHGTFRPVTLASPCAMIRQSIKEQPELEFLEMLTPILTDSAACGTR